MRKINIKRLLGVSAAVLAMTIALLTFTGCSSKDENGKNATVSSNELTNVLSEQETAISHGDTQTVETNRAQTTVTETTAPTAPTTSSAQTTSAASDYIGVEAAKKAALNHAGVNASDADFTKAALDKDKDDLLATYDIQFSAGGYDYDYDILATGGKIVDFEKERTESTSAKNLSSYIGVEAAKTAALSDAGVSESDAVFRKAKMDSDEGMMKYEIEFTAGKYEYEYEINAVNGKILEREKEFAD